MQREQVGARELELDLPDGSAIEDAWAALAERHPVLAPSRAYVRFARNGEYGDGTTRLADGDEVAFIPPVSGGAPEPVPDEPRRILELREAPFGPAVLDELAERLATPGDGAVVAFVGRTRVSPGTPAPGQEAEAARHEGRSVEALDYEAHEAMVGRVLEAIADEIAERFGVRRLAILHRTGSVPLGEASVAVVTVSPHRDAAFRAARYAIDETKARAPIWKAERFIDGRVWVGEPARTGPAGDARDDDDRDG